MPSSARPIEPLRGTLLFADRTYQAHNGQWIVAGTLNCLTFDNCVSGTVVHVALHVYTRIQLDVPGDYKIRIIFSDKSAPPTVPPLFTLESTAAIVDPRRAIEMGIKLPEFDVVCPENPTHERPVGMGIAAWLQVGEQDIGSADLHLFFRCKE